MNNYTLNTANEIIELIKDIDVSREYYYLTETYDIWVFARYLVPNSKDRKYIYGTHQEYLLEAYPKNPLFRELCVKHKGLMELYRYTMQHPETSIAS